MFRFANPEFLYFFLILPVFIVLFIITNILKKKSVMKFGNIRMMKKMMPELSLKRGYLKFWLMLIAIGLGIFMLSRPQFGTKMELVEKEGIELVIAIDVSNSMLARDVAPNRLARAKQMLTRLIEKRENDKVAIVVFAGEAYIQLPMTSDVQSAKIFLESINTNLVPVQGTALASAIDVSMSCFTNDKDVEKTIILLTDAENHEGDVIKATKKAVDAGMHVCVAGIGSVDGSMIPVSLNSNQMKKDSKGEYVVTKLDEEVAKQIAKAGNGIYVKVDNTNGALNHLLTFLDKQEKHELESVSYSEYDEKFRYFAWAMFAVLLVEVLIFNKKNRLFRNIFVFKKKQKN